MLNLEQKKAVVAEVSGVIAGAQAVALAEYRGLTVEQMTKLRSAAHAEKVYLRVVKNSLARLAVKATSFECLTPHLVGPLAFACSKDPVAVARLLVDFTKDNVKCKITAGALDGRLMSVAEMKALATLPSREQLLATLLATLNAPMTQFVRTLNEVPAGFVRALAAVRDQKQAAA